MKLKLKLFKMNLWIKPAKKFWIGRSSVDTSQLIYMSLLRQSFFAFSFKHIYAAVMTPFFSGHHFYRRARLAKTKSKTKRNENCERSRH